MPEGDGPAVLLGSRPATYAAASRLAERRKESLAGLVDRLICAELEREGMTAPPEYIRPSRVAPVDMPAQQRRR